MSKLEIFLWLIACCLIFPIGFLILRIHQINTRIQSAKTDNADNQFQEFKETLQRDTADANRRAEMQRAKADKLEDQRMQLQKDLTSQVERNYHEYIQHVNRQFEKLDNAVRQFSDLFSKGTKQTGTLAEGLLNRLFHHIQALWPRNSKFSIITTQQKIPSTNTIPDVTIKSVDGIFPPVYIDAKYPVESAKNYLDHRTPDTTRKWVKALQKHVKDIASKYVDAPQSPFAIMFSPSDVIYNAAVEQAKGFGTNIKQSESPDRSFIEFCFDHKVIPTSPVNIVGILSTLERFFNLFDQIKNNEAQIAAINQWMKETKRFYVNLKKLIDQHNSLGYIIQALIEDLNKITRKSTALRLDDVEATAINKLEKPPDLG